MSVDIENNSEVARKDDNFVKCEVDKNDQVQDKMGVDVEEKIDDVKIKNKSSELVKKATFEDLESKTQSDSELIEPRPVKAVGFLSDTNDNSREERRRRPHEAEDAFSGKLIPSGVRNRVGKKRHHSVSHSTGNQKPMSFSNKRRRKTVDRKPEPVFLLGGTITDPLNLNSLVDEEISKIVNAVTPMSSPLPHLNKDPDPVIVPADVTDPLKLNVSAIGEDNANLTRTLNRSGKKRKRAGKGDNEIVSPTTELPDQGKNLLKSPILGIEPGHLQNLQSSNQKLDKIVSPVVPDGSDAGSAKFRKRKMKQDPSSKISRALLIESDDETASDNTVRRQHRTASPEKRKYKRQHSKDPPKVPNFHEHNKKFQYGNYNRYYGYRNPDKDDPRLPLLRKDWFEGKDCLDIGCNTGHVTLFIAKEYHPKKIVGIDIDGNLIGVARKNIKHCLMDKAKEQSASREQKFPVSMEKSFGPISKTVLPSAKQSSFPSNVLFRCANFVLTSDALLQAQKPEYDTILCLSVTKWVHLNWGDSGIKRFFKRIFMALKPGGCFILEPQAWPSYKKKKKLTETVFKNFQEIQFMPDQFKGYLLSTEVGFSSCETIGVPFNQSKGFRRPMMMFTKLNPEKSHRHHRTSESSRHRTSSNESSSDRHHHHHGHHHRDHHHRHHHSSSHSSSKNERESTDSRSDKKSHTKKDADKIPDSVATKDARKQVITKQLESIAMKVESNEEKILDACKLGEEKTELAKQGKMDITKQVQVKTDTSNQVQVKTDTSNQVQVKTDSSKQVQEKTDSSKQVQEKMDTSEGVEEKSKTSTRVEENTDTSKQVQEKTETSIEVKTEISKLAEVKTETSCDGATEGDQGKSKQEESAHLSSKDLPVCIKPDIGSSKSKGDTSPQSSTVKVALPSSCSAESNKSSPDHVQQCSRYKVSVTDSPDRTG